MTLAQATQPVAADPYGWIDKAAGLIIALTGLVTAIFAAWRASRTAGRTDALAGRQDSLAAHARSIDGQMTLLALHTPAPGNGPGKPAVPPPAGVSIPPAGPKVSGAGFGFSDTPGPTSSVADEERERGKW